MMTAERLPVTSRLMVVGEYLYLGYKTPEFDPGVPDYQRALSGLFRARFGTSYLETWQEVTADLYSGSSLVLAVYTRTQEVVGAAIQELKRPSFLPGVRVQINKLRVVAPDYERRGIGTNMLIHSHNINGAPDVHMVRTRVPAIPALYEDSGILSSDEAGKLSMSPLNGHTYDKHPLREKLVSVYRPLGFINPDLKSKPHPLDRITGLVENVYKVGEEKPFDPTRASEKVLGYHNQMVNLGLGPGAAFIMVAPKKGRSNFVEEL